MTYCDKVWNLEGCIFIKFGIWRVAFFKKVFYHLEMFGWDGLLIFAQSTIYMYHVRTEMRQEFMAVFSSSTPPTLIELILNIAQISMG